MFSLKGYSSGQSHFSEINVELAEKKEFIAHFVQKCLEMCKNKQNVVLNDPSEALGNRSEIARILVLAMTTMVRAEVILSVKLLLVIRCFTNTNPCPTP